MELGYWIYFFVVFVLGGLLLFGCVVYFVRELILRSDRKWVERSRWSKLFFFAVTTLAAVMLSGFLRMVWVTRIRAIPGSYESSGAWGTATLNMQANGRFEEHWKFSNEYNGKPEGEGTITGQWDDKGRDWFTRDIGLNPFVGLAEYDRDHKPGRGSGIVMGYGGTTSIEVDSGADIVFRKNGGGDQ